jgi:membrane-associated phospholipid phosphatase
MPASIPAGRDLPPPPSPTGPRAFSPLRTAALLAAASVVLLVLVAVRWEPLLCWDRGIAGRLHRWAVAEPGLTGTNRVLSDWVWDPWTMRLLTASAVVLVWLWGERALALWVAATSALGAALSQGLKWAVDRERPRWPHPVDSAQFAAFPSGHAMTATVTCGLLLWLARRQGVGPWVWRTALLVAAVSVAGVGFTRLWLGVHWSSDVLGGWLFGGCLVAFSVVLHGRVTLSREP